MEIEAIQQLADTQLPHIAKAFDAESLAIYGTDSYGLYRANPSLILFPRDTDEVVAIIAFANKYLIPIVPSGGRTGLCGGATATRGEMIVSSAKLVAPLIFNDDEGSVGAMAGTITAELQQQAHERGFLFPIDFAAAGSSNIGGNIATNAGGIHVIHYGLTRDWISSLTVVTGKGDVLHLNKGLVKNATGYDLRHLFIGSEGTLGIIVAATIKLTRPPVNPSTLLLGFDILANVTAILQLLKQEADLLAFEFFTDDALQAALDGQTFAPALDNRCPYYVIAEYDKLLNPAPYADKEAQDNHIITKILESGLIADGKMAFSQAERTLFWKHREQIPVAINKLHPYKNDISIRIGSIPGFITQLNELLHTHYHNLKVLWFGHIGDGNLHINIIRPEAMAVTDFRTLCDGLSVQLYQLIQAFNGSISAEHGVGLAKKDFLQYTRSNEEIAYMRAIKQVFDPNSILNPGKIF